MGNNTHTHTQHRHHRLVAALVTLAAVGVAVIVLISSSGGARSPVGTHSSRPQRTALASTGRASRLAVARARHQKPAAKPAAPAKLGGSTSGIPQQNGGDGDPDNNGGPNDGDGQI